MKVQEKIEWHEANKRYLMASLGVVREHLDSYRASKKNEEKQKYFPQPENLQAWKEYKTAAKNLPGKAAIDTLTDLFGLSSFERNILLLCAGMELDSSFAKLVYSLNENNALSGPTFSLALSSLPDAHWSALMYNAPLRYWRLIKIDDGRLLTDNQIRIDEKILHYLTGIKHIDEQLSGFIESFLPVKEIVSSHSLYADKIIQSWSQKNEAGTLPLIQLCGPDKSGKKSIAYSACTRLGLNIYSFSAIFIPSIINEINDFARLWEREAILSASILYLDCDNLTDPGDTFLQNINYFCEFIRSGLIISSPQNILKLQRPSVVLNVNKPTSQEQHNLWKKFLGTKAKDLDGRLNSIVTQFDLSTDVIQSAASEVIRKYEGNGKDKIMQDEDQEKILWKTCCTYSSPKLLELVQRIEPLAVWDDLVLPEQQKSTLKEIAMHVRQRAKVYGEWGFAAKSSRGLGISVLFAGESGTGKTMASEVLANELQLDLYRIDLSQVVNKYIGETEKNLKQIFDAAEEGGAILLFDEADALFGKRSEVKDSHDRYANIEVSYLLQRMEGYRGLAILTTNMKNAMDKAFMRRIRFCVQFPFPDITMRKEIWQKIIPSKTPTENLDMNELARFNIAGGNIRNIALNAAFIAADSGGPLKMSHIVTAAKSEYSKLEKPISNVEVITFQ